MWQPLLPSRPVCYRRVIGERPSCGFACSRSTPVAQPPCSAPGPQRMQLSLRDCISCMQSGRFCCALRAFGVGLACSRSVPAATALRGAWPACRMHPTHRDCISCMQSVGLPLACVRSPHRMVGIGLAPGAFVLDCRSGHSCPASTGHRPPRLPPPAISFWAGGSGKNEMGGVNSRASRL